MINVHDFKHGARGLRVAWLCEEIGLPYAMRHVSFPTNEDYRMLNPFGTVPFLQDSDVSMSESVAMLLYVAQKYGRSDTLPPVNDGRYARVLQFTLFGEAALSSPMTPLLAARFGAPNDQKRNWSAVGIEARIKATIEQLTGELGSREFIVGDALSLADISVATALRIWGRGLGQDILAPLRGYCERLQERSAFRRAIEVHA